MIKSELVTRIVERNPHLYKKEVEAVVDTILGTITDALTRADRVELRDFGVFSTKARSSRTGRNPRTGAVVEVEEKHAIAFKTGRELRRAIQKPTRQVGPLTSR